MPRPPKKKNSHRVCVWTQLLSRGMAEQLERCLDSQPVFAVTSSQLHRCHLCLGNIDGHHMRYHLLECRSAACESAPESAACESAPESVGVSNAWIKTLSCAATDKPALSQHGAHPQVDQTVLNRMTLQMRRVTRDLVASGACPMAILSELVGQLQLTADTVPPLGTVQQTAYHHKRVLLMATALVNQMRELIRVLWYRADLDETTPFTFACLIDAFGIPEIGNGSGDRPFLIGVTTKRQSGYHMVVVGTSDASRSMHVAAVFLTSHLRPAQYAQVFSSAVYQLVTGSSLKIRYVMGDADDAQFNGFEEAVIFNCPSATYLMCFFHVMLNVKKRAKQLSAPDRSLVYNHVYHIHHARDQFDAEAELAHAVTAWSAQPTLKAFLAYFRREWLDSRFNRWQCYQSAIGHAKTNNPLEHFNKTFKRDYTRRQLLPFNTSMLKMQQLCTTTAVVSRDFKASCVVTPDLPRRLKYLRKAGLLSHARVQRTSLDLLVDGSQPETHILVKEHGVHKSAFPLARRNQDRLPSLSMETYKQPRDGCYADLAKRRCPCSWWFKNGCCVHLQEGLEVVGAAFDAEDQLGATFVRQRRRRRVVPTFDDQAVPDQGGRRTQVGPALALQ